MLSDLEFYSISLTTWTLVFGFVMAGEQTESRARHRHVSVPELLRQAAEQLVRGQRVATNGITGNRYFPDGLALGAFNAPVEDWRSLANETGA